MKDVVTNRCSAICCVCGRLLVSCKVTLSDRSERALEALLAKLAGDPDQNLVCGDVLGGVVHHRHGLK